MGQIVIMSHFTELWFGLLHNLQHEKHVFPAFFLHLFVSLQYFSTCPTILQFSHVAVLKHFSVAWLFLLHVLQAMHGQNHIVSFYFPFVVSKIK